jgi:tetratricopeptide (TPR) repeat protein/transcriptional regulator with XRE-family HTH domain
MAEHAVTQVPARRQLAQRRKALGLTQEELAELLSVERSTVVRWERGETAPSPWIRPKLARALQVSAERVEELLAAGAQHDSAPGAGARRGNGAAVVPRQLPAAVPDFTGRAAELQALTRILDETGAGAPGTVVISAIGGTAGVGKTALALHWAHQVADRFPDGQLHANLRGFDPSGAPSAPSDVARRFLNALGVPDDQIPSDTEARESLYRSTLAGKRMLIVLDNARGAAQVRPLLPAGPGCFVLVTSRHQLTSLGAAHGAHVLTLDLLSRPDAHELVARRLDRTRVTDEPEAVSELIALCARLPLAVSIAVARANSRPASPLASLVAEFRDATSRLDMLDADDPASSVRAVFSWSYQGLSDTAARLFRLLSMHPGPDMTIPAAASLAGLALDQARRAVGELTGAHLLAEHAHGRFIFHDLLRTYAAEQARANDDDAERRAALHRLLDYYLHTSDAICRLLDPTLSTISLTAPQPGTIPEVPGDYPQAWTWAEAEHQVLLAAARQATAARFETHGWQILRALEPFFFRRGRWHEFTSAARTALEAARRAGDVPGQAHMHRVLGRGCALLGSPEDAQAHLSHAVEGYRALGYRADEARAHLNVGSVLSGRGRYTDALTHAKRALGLYRTAGHPAGQAGALNNIGMYHTYRGDYQEAIACCEKALSGFGELGNRHGAAYALDSLGYAYHCQGQNAQAIACYEQSLDALREYGDRPFQAEILTHLGDTHHAAGNPEAARSAWQAALSILRELQHPDAGDVDAKLNNLGGPRLACRAPEPPERTEPRRLSVDLIRPGPRGGRLVQGDQGEGACQVLGRGRCVGEVLRPRAAVDDEVDTGDQARVVRAQPGDGVADVGRGAGRAHRDHRRSLPGPPGRPAPLLVTGGAAEPGAALVQDPARAEPGPGPLRQQFRVVGVRRGRREAVDPDAVRRQVHGGGPDEVVHAALVERVGDDARGTGPAVGRGNADDRALDPALGHRPADVLGVEEVTQRRHAHGSLEVLRGLVEQPPAAEQRRVVHEDVDVPPSREHLTDVALHRGLVGHVTGRGHRLAAVALDAGDARLDRRLVHVVAGHLRAVPGQGQRDPAADIGSDAGDEPDLPSKRDLHRQWSTSAG